MIEPPVREEPVGASDGTDVVGPPAARRHVKVYDPTKLSVAPPETIFQVYKMLGDPKRGITERVIVKQYLRGEISKHDFLNSINFAKFDENTDIRAMAESFNSNMVDTPEFNRAIHSDQNHLVEIDTAKLIEIDTANGTRLAREVRDGDRVFQISEGDNVVGGLIVGKPNAEGVAQANWRGVGAVGERQMHVLLRQIKHKMPELKRIEGKNLGVRARSIEAENAQPKGWDIPEEVMDSPKGPISMAAMEKLALRLDVSVDQVMSYIPGGGSPQGFLHATNMLYDAAEMRTKSIADEISRLSLDNTLDDPSQQLIYEGMRMLNIQQGIGESLKNQASDMGRGLQNVGFGQRMRAAKIRAGENYKTGRLLENFTPLRGTEQEVKEQIDSAIINEGSMDQAIRLMRAIADGASEDTVRVLRNGTKAKRIQDMIVEMWYFGWLSSVPLHAGNIFGNSINVLYQIPERALAAQIGKARQALGRGSAEDAIVEGEATAMMQGYATFLKEALTASWATAKTGVTTHQKLDQNAVRAWSAETWSLDKSDKAFARQLGKTLDGIGMLFNTTSKALSVADEFFGVWSTKANLTALGHREATRLGLTGKKYAEKVNEVLMKATPDQLAEARAFGHALTLTTPLGSTGKKIQAVLNNNPLIGKAVVPFFKTPTNIVKFAGVRTPLGFFAKSVKADIAKGGAAGDLALARITLGTGIAFTIANEVWSERVTGAGPTSPGLREDWLLTHQPFSMLVGDTWVSYDRADPIGIVFGIAASAAEMTGNMRDDDSLDIMSALSLAISKSVVSKTWLNSMSKVLKAFTSGNEDALKRMVAGVAGNFIPGSGLLSSIKGDLPANKNYWGEDITHMTLGPKILSPLFTMKANSPAASDWLWENRVTIRSPTQRQSFPSKYGNASVELTTHQHARFKELAGNDWKDPNTGLGFLDTMNSIIAGTHNISGEWNSSTNGPDGVKALIFKNLQSYFRSGARARLLWEDEELQSKANREGKAAYEALTIGPQI